MSSSKKRVNTLNSNSRNSKKSKKKTFEKKSKNFKTYTNTYNKKAKELQEKSQEKNKDKKNTNKEVVIPTPKSSYPEFFMKRKKPNYLSETLENKFLVIGIISFLFLFSILLINQYFNNNPSSLTSTGYNIKDTFSEAFSKIYEAKSTNNPLSQNAEGWQNLLEIRPLALLFQGIFGKLIVSSQLDTIGSFIVTIALWLLFFLTVSDIVATFSSFSRQLSYGIGFLITVIIANFGIVFNFLSLLVILFSFLFGASVMVGLIGSFLAFLAVNLGIHKLGVWALKRKAMINLAKSKIGAESLKESIEAIDKTGKAIRKVGEKAEEEA
ncbi:hypothetical protein GYA25_02585, partial [Candidatus Woesearchaeota archaeon]|nr:hypothetical protein [Candidatus Woesearchaeota archaeon]